MFRFKFPFCKKKDEYTQCKCLYCGFEEEAPTWLVEEIEEFDDHFVNGCIKCNRDTMVTLEYYNKVKNR